MPEVYCHSQRYLCVMNYWSTPGKPPNSLYYYTTIDMQTGDKVRLDDLVEFSEGFIEYMRHGVFQKPYWTGKELNASSELVQEWLNALTDEQILQELAECSKEQSDFYDSEGEYDLQALFHRNAFRVEDGRLVIIFSKSNETEVSLIAHLDDIEMFLKVPKW